MAGLGQFDDFIIPEWDVPVYDFSLPDFSTDVFADYPVDFDYGYDYSFDYDFGATDFGTADYSYDFSTDTIGYDVADPMAGDPYWNYDYSYDYLLPSEYGDAFPVDAETSGIDYTSGVVGDYSTPEAWGDVPEYTTTPTEEWVDYEAAAETQAASSFPDATSAASSFSIEFPDVDWNALLQAGMNIYKLYASMQQPQRASPYGKPSVMRDPRTGQMVPALRDPRTGQMVPAVRDPRSGALVPASQQSRELIPGVPNWALYAGAGVIAFALLSKPARRYTRRRR